MKISIDLNTSTLWTVFWTLVAVVVLSASVMLYASDISNDMLVKEMVQSGINPIEAKCAVSGGNSKQCILRQLNTPAAVFGFIADEHLSTGN